ncbi:MAG: hypothetical protein IPL79_02095 [Myxococcales bacterium]|nr:hypothetical protein [Myxococcales bacterium]
MKKSHLVVLVCGLYTNALLACADGPAAHDLDDRLVSSLSTDEIHAACKQIPLPSADALVGYKAEVCLLAEQTSCNPTTFEACVASADDLPACIIEEGDCEATEDSCIFLQDDNDVQTCNATVDEVYSCDKDLYLRYESMAAVNCSNQEIPASEWPASCLVVNQKCPGFFDD